MRTDRRLTLQEAPWLGEPGFVRLAAALGRDGARVLATGGAVRDSLIGKGHHPEDLDLVSSLSVEEARGALSADGLAVDEHPFMKEVLLVDLPRELYGPSHASVVCLGDASAEAFARDARRRDFTVNAVSCDPDGRVEDHVGGLADADARRLRFVSEDSVTTDPARLIRYFRMRLRLEESEPDPETLSVVRKHAGLARSAPGIRLIRELVILCDSHDGRDVRSALALMEETGVLAVLLPSVDLGRVDRYLASGCRKDMNLPAWEALALLGVSGDPLLAWGDWRDEAIAMRAAAFEEAGDDLSLGALSDAFRKVVKDWKREEDVVPVPAVH